MTERLDKFLVSQGIGSRKEVTRLVRRGSVMVDGKPTSTADCKIDPENSKVTVEGKEIVYRRFLYIMMNKPAGVLSAGSYHVCACTPVGGRIPGPEDGVCGDQRGKISSGKTNVRSVRQPGGVSEETQDRRSFSG